jgi:hypothetical protein
MNDAPHGYLNKMIPLPKPIKQAGNKLNKSSIHHYQSSTSKASACQDKINVPPHREHTRVHKPNNSAKVMPRLLRPLDGLSDNIGRNVTTKENSDPTAPLRMNGQAEQNQRHNVFDYLVDNRQNDRLAMLDHLGLKCGDIQEAADSGHPGFYNGVRFGGTVEQPGLIQTRPANPNNARALSEVPLLDHNSQFLHDTKNLNTAMQDSRATGHSQSGADHWNTAKPELGPIGTTYNPWIHGISWNGQTPPFGNSPSPRLGGSIPAEDYNTKRDVIPNQLFPSQNSLSHNRESPSNGVIKRPCPSTSADSFDADFGSHNEALLATYFNSRKDSFLPPSQFQDSRNIVGNSESEAATLQQRLRDAVGTGGRIYASHSADDPTIMTRLTEQHNNYNNRMNLNPRGDLKPQIPYVGISNERLSHVFESAEPSNWIQSGVQPSQDRHANNFGVRNADSNKASFLLPSQIDKDINMWEKYYPPVNSSPLHDRDLYHAQQNQQSNHSYGSQAVPPNASQLLNKQTYHPTSAGLVGSTIDQRYSMSSMTNDDIPHLNPSKGNEMLTLRTLLS